jgi:hypothetical protein
VLFDRRFAQNGFAEPLISVNHRDRQRNKLGSFDHHASADRVVQPHDVLTAFPDAAQTGAAASPALFFALFYLCRKRGKGVQAQAIIRLERRFCWRALRKKNAGALR